jgi:hypothetical protein
MRTPPSGSSRQLLNLLRVRQDDGPGPGHVRLEHNRLRIRGAEHRQVASADLGEVQTHRRTRRLTEVRQHLGTQLRRPARGQHRVAQERRRTYVVGQAVGGELQVRHYGPEQVVELVGDGAGHACQAVRLLELQMLGMDHRPRGDRKSVV